MFANYEGFDLPFMRVVSQTLVEGREKAIEVHNLVAFVLVRNRELIEVPRITIPGHSFNQLASFVLIEVKLETCKVINLKRVGNLLIEGFASVMSPLFDFNILIERKTELVSAEIIE
jgi:hypothetical protein